MRGYNICLSCQHPITCRAVGCDGHHEAVCDRCKRVTPWWTAVPCEEDR